MDLKLDIKLSLTPQQLPAANEVAARMCDAAPNWWSVVMNIYAQVGLP